jgi:hypothetical protein
MALTDDEILLPLPSPERMKRLRQIHKLLKEHKESGDTGALGLAVQLMLTESKFLAYLKAKGSGPVSSAAELMPIAWDFFYFQLYERDQVAAATILWSEDTFTLEPRCTRLIWQALKTKRKIALIGGGGQSKSFAPSAFFLLEWCLDPEWTRFQVASATEDHLLKNLFSDIVRLHQDAALALPGKPDSESISLDKKRGQGIFTLTLPGGPQSKGKIQGAHTKPRPEHPIFGKRSRVFQLIDEAQEVPQNIYAIIPNRFSTVVPSDMEHLKFVLCANPKDIHSEFGKELKPKKGWEAITLDDEVWLSEGGWTVISLDATKHENVVEKRIRFPGMVTWEGVYETWLRDRCHGDINDPQFFTYVRGKFPPMGTQSTIIKQAHLTASEGDWIFDTIAENFAAHDVAFEGDKPTFAAGRVGRAIGWLDAEGVRHDLQEPRMAIQVDAVVMLNRGDTQDLADENMDRCRDLNVKPEHYGIDRTGQRGVHDIIARQWGQKVNATQVVDGVAPIHGLEYGSKATTVKVADEDTATPYDLYDRLASELWYAGAKLFEYDVVRLGRGVPSDALAQLAARCGGMKTGKGKILSVEGKPSFKKRTGQGSPDEADAILMMLHVARISTTGLIPKAKDTQEVKEPRVQRGWNGFDLAFGGAKMDGMTEGVEEMSDMTKD